ncbi:MAG: DinB family protein [Chloroflexi bacterium]|nr:DinB family protein [Chloroflexota bacterium]
MSIQPDTKNWTWVLDRPCPECGFDGSVFPCRRVADALAENAAAWPPILASPLVRQRPSDHTWSALEYGCHVRDVFRIFDVRLNLMLTERDPLFANWDQDQTAVDEHYDAQDPAKVATALEEAGEKLVASFRSVPDDAWSRPGRRSDGSAFTVDTFARYLLHDPVHHLWDVRRGFELIRAG